MTALFTAVSNGCVTGLTVVDTATYWTLWRRSDQPVSRASTILARVRSMLSPPSSR